MSVRQSSRRLAVRVVRRLVATGLLVGGGLGAGAASSEAMVWVQLPAGTELESGPSAAGGMRRADLGDGARIVRLAAPDASPVVLTDGFYGAADPDVSFDGQRMLFAGKRTEDDPWNVFEMRLDGSEPRQITHCSADCRHPVYQGTTYRIVADHPWRELTFVSDAAGELDEFGEMRSTSLYSVRSDGSGMRRLTFNPSSDLDPAVLPDGRLVFSSWQRRSLDRGVRGRIALFAAQTDGLDYALFAGDPGRRIKHMPCVTANRLVVFVEADNVPWDGAGTLASVDLRRNLHSYRPITEERDGLFVFPSPVANGTVLVSRRPVDGSGTHGIVRLDPRTGLFESVFDDPELHDVQAVAASPRPEPDGRSSVVTDDRPTGSFYCLSVHETDAPETVPPAGSRPRLRVLEGVPEKDGSSTGGSELEPELLPRRVLGEIEVEADGSFHLEVPAGLPIELQLLDDRGMALRSCGWIWVGRRETRGCIGCHEDPERVPENRLALAVTHPAVELTLPPDERRTVDFARDVWPIVSTSCRSCHRAAEAGPSFADGDPVESYRVLLAVDERGERLHVHPGHARTSPLVAHAAGHVDRQGALSAEDVRALAEWIDLGAVYAAPSVAAAPRSAP
jgi:hypothetical protein